MHRSLDANLKVVNIPQAYLLWIRGTFLLFSSVACFWLKLFALGWIKLCPQTQTGVASATGKFYERALFD
jgi:hypothetical protein